MIGFTRRATAAQATAVAGTRPYVPGAIGSVAKRLYKSFNPWFWAIVGVPTLIAAVYYFGIASDMYVSEASFTVHGPAKIQLPNIASFLGGGAGSGSGDTGIVKEFILSRDAARKLEQDNNLRAILSRPGADLFTRFPGVLFWRNDFERLYRRYLDFVSVDVPSDGDIATLRVRSFEPGDAQIIAKALLADSEKLVNDLNERARKDALATFQREVEDSQQRLSQIQDRLTSYRVKANMLDPKAEATGPFALLAQLNKEEAATKAQLTDVMRNAPRSPQIALFRTRIATLDQLITEQRSKITGSGDSVATAMNEYERLNVQSEMETKILAQAVAAREQARLEVQRQQLYLEEIAQPNLPDYPTLPNRGTSFATVVGTCLLAYGIAWLLVAGVREHASA